MSTTRIHLFIGVALLCLGAQSHAAESLSKPNIIVILADDFGWGSLGCYGAPQTLKTPNLDRLAREGRRFTNAYAPGSVCSPTRYGLMTGRYVWRTTSKNGRVLQGKAPLHIETDRLTLASLCKSQGYRTGAFGKWHLGLTNELVFDWSKPLRPGPLEIGFDHFFGMAANLGNGPHSFIVNDRVVGQVPGEPITVRGAGKKVSGTSGIEKPWQEDQVMATLTQNVIKWIDENHEAPFFVYFAPNAVHEPITPNPAMTGSPFGKYGDFIQELDGSVGQILQKLDELKLSENTLIIFTSDNGGVVQPGRQNIAVAMNAGLKINGPLRAGKHSEWEGGFRVPLLVRWPTDVPANTVSDQVICLTDVLATLAAIFETPILPENAEDSFNVLRAFTESERGAPVRDHVILQAADATYAIRKGDWKLIERIDAPQTVPSVSTKSAANSRPSEDAGPEQNELYNLQADPSEQADVFHENRKRGAAMRKALAEIRDRGFSRPLGGE